MVFVYEDRILVVSVPCENGSSTICKCPFTDISERERSAQGETTEISSSAKDTAATVSVSHQVSLVEVPYEELSSSFEVELAVRSKTRQRMVKRPSTQEQGREGQGREETWSEILKVHYIYIYLYLGFNYFYFLLAYFLFLPVSFTTWRKPISLLHGESPFLNI